MADGADGGGGAFVVDAGAVPFPGGDEGPGAGVGGDVHAVGEGAGGGFAVASEEEAPGSVGLVGGDLLFQDRRDQGFQDEAGAGQAQARVAAVRLVDDAVAGGEGGRVVVGAEEGGEAVQEPVSAGAPGFGFDRSSGCPRDADGAGARRGAGGAPDRAVGGDAEGWVGGAPAEGAEGEAQVEGAVGDPPAFLAARLRRYGGRGCGGRGRRGQAGLLGVHVAEPTRAVPGAWAACGPWPVCANPPPATAGRCPHSLRSPCGTPSRKPD